MESSRFPFGQDFVPVKFPEPEDSRRGIVGYSEEIPAELLYSAYLQGIFPWFNEDKGDPVLWWNPDPRFVLQVENFHIPSRLVRFLKHTPYFYTMDRDFESVIRGCAEMKRRNQQGTWLSPTMINAYCSLHALGIAHSVEAWYDDDLAGGFYGVLIGRVFFGESMFTKRSDSSKSAFVRFVQIFMECGGRLVDSQVYTDNIARFGARNISRNAFLYLEQELLFTPLEEDLNKAFAFRANPAADNGNIACGR
ncbi:MAG: leucyl/phenylalanyl-tRNA--protein transferase [Treponema sp.]|jgi:leucyl/phenylalanyl-tRNA--protein transferase|nr:leucyl/phenylalanyl-tRNA--protein transferase [Treponema sp.]